MGQHRVERIGRRLAEAADRGVGHRPAEFLEQRLVPCGLLHQLHRLFGADPARRALAAAFVLEEAHEVERHRLHVVLIGQDDDGVGADETAVALERPEIERDVGHRGRQYAPRRAARKIPLEAMAVGHAGTIFLDQLTRRDPRRGNLDARLLDPARDRVAPHPLVAVAALAGEPIGPLLDDVANPVNGLDIVDQGRTAEQPDLGGVGRAVAGQAAFALEALEHRRFLAADIGAGATA